MSVFVRNGRFATSAVLSLALISLGSAQWASKPGVQELTGQLIVRPLQVDALMNKSLPYSMIPTIRNRAKTRLAPQQIRYYADVDEYVVKVPAGKNENTYAAELLATGDYQYVQPNWRCFPVKITNDPRYGEQWHHTTIQSDKAWDLWTGSNNFTTAYVDTGIKTTHEDLAPLRIPGYNSVDRKAEVDGGQVEDINGHGTHVSGCGSAYGNNGKGVSGVGWNFKVMHVRTSNSPGGGAAFDDIMSGARWAIDHGAKTASASYSGVDGPSVGTTGTEIKNSGGLFLYAAGNDNRDLSGFQYADTIVVGASAPGDVKAGFSAYGRGVNVFAPGQDILSSTMDGGYGFASGTSMATPVCNGVLALLWSANPLLTPAEAQDILYTTCDTIGSSAIFGNGRVNAFKAVQAALVTSAQDIDITTVAVQSGTLAGGNLVSVRDTSLTNSYNVTSKQVSGLGATAGSTMTVVLPTDKGNIASFQLTTKFNVTGDKPATLMAYLFNKNTGLYDMIVTKGAYGGQQTEFVLRVTKNVSNYVAANGTVKMIVRSVVPARFGSTTNQLKIGHAKARFSVRP
ncbi:MAG TPA: S8 family serine peptidase [Fimbriimonas sp.]|nr:S8 family serine peptidase [Fimbriimonas sp.]